MSCIVVYTSTERRSLLAPSCSSKYNYNSCLVSCLPPLLSVPQPCQTIYQVFHDTVTRLIQYGVLYVAEVSLQSSCCWTKITDHGG